MCRNWENGSANMSPIGEGGEKIGFNGALLAMIDYPSKVQCLDQACTVCH